MHEIMNIVFKLMKIDIQSIYFIYFWFYIPHNVTTVIHRKVSGEHINSHAHMLVKEKERELNAHGEDESRENQIQ